MALNKRCQPRTPTACCSHIRRGLAGSHWSQKYVRPLLPTKSALGCSMVRQRLAAQSGCEFRWSCLGEPRQCKQRCDRRLRDSSAHFECLSTTHWRWYRCREWLAKCWAPAARSSRGEYTSVWTRPSNRSSFRTGNHRRPGSFRCQGTVRTRRRNQPHSHHHSEYRRRTPSRHRLSIALCQRSRRLPSIPGPMRTLSPTGRTASLRSQRPFLVRPASHQHWFVQLTGPRMCRYRNFLTHNPCGRRRRGPSRTSSVPSLHSPRQPRRHPERR